MKRDESKSDHKKQSEIQKHANKKRSLVHSHSDESTPSVALSLSLKSTIRMFPF